MSDQQMASHLHDILSYKDSFGMGYEGGKGTREGALKAWKTRRAKMGSKTAKKKVIKKKSVSKRNCPKRVKCPKGTRKRCIKAGELEDIMELYGRGVIAGDHMHYEDDDYGEGLLSKGERKVIAKKAASKNPWIGFIQLWAFEHNMSYRDALQDPAAKKKYCNSVGLFSKGKACKSKSGSKTVKRKAVGWQECIKGKRAKAKKAGRKTNLKDISKFYCKKNKKCYLTEALKRKRCK